jgi:WD40 repeat protein
MLRNDHDIPDLDFNSTGKYLVSTSIDGTVKIFFLDDGWNCISTCNFNDNTWKWMTRFIPTRMVINYDGKNEENENHLRWITTFQVENTALAKSFANRKNIIIKWTLTSRYTDKFL